MGRGEGAGRQGGRKAGRQAGGLGWPNRQFSLLFWVFSFGGWVAVMFFWDVIPGWTRGDDLYDIL